MAGDGLDPPADYRLHHGPKGPAFLPSDWHGLYAHGSIDPFDSHEFPVHSFGGGLYRYWLVDLSSRIIPRRADGIGRPPRHGAIALPSGRQYWFCGWAIGRRFHYLPGGQGAVAWFALVALGGIMLLTRVSFWYTAKRKAMAARTQSAPFIRYPHAKIGLSLIVLSLLVFSKFLYMASLSNYYTFYLIETFGVSVRDAQLYLFVYLGAVAAGTIIGGPIGDRFGRRTVIWFSVLGVLPFTLLLPYANLQWTIGLSVIIGLILSSAFPAIVVFAQELVPSKVGAISGLFFGFAFGMGGFGAALLGAVADRTSIDFVYHIVSFYPPWACSRSCCRRTGLADDPAINHLNNPVALPPEFVIMRDQ